jgi:hypothetical protein
MPEAQRFGFLCERALPLGSNVLGDQDVPRTAVSGRALGHSTLPNVPCGAIVATSFTAHDEVEASYDDSAERIRHPDYQMDLRLAAKNRGNRLVDVGALPPNPEI